MNDLNKISDRERIIYEENIKKHLERSVRYGRLLAECADTLRDVINANGEQTPNVLKALYSKLQKQFEVEINVFNAELEQLKRDRENGN